MEMIMNEITEKDLFNALAPYHPLTKFQDFINSSTEAADVSELRNEIKKLTRQRNHLKSEITKLQKHRLAWLEEEVKERKRVKEFKGVIKKKISNAELMQQLEDLRVNQGMTYTELAKLIGIHITNLHTFIQKPPQRSKYLPAIRKVVAKYSLEY